MRDDVAIAVLVFVLILLILAMLSWFGYGRWHELAGIGAGRLA